MHEQFVPFTLERGSDERADFSIHITGYMVLMNTRFSIHLLLNSCYVSQNDFLFTLKEWLQRILEFFYLYHILQSSYICHCGEVCVENFLAEYGCRCSLMVKMILLSCHRVSLKTPNSYCHRICVIVSHGRHALNLGTFIQALNLHKQNSEFSSVFFFKSGSAAKKANQRSHRSCAVVLSG